MWALLEPWSGFGECDYDFSWNGMREDMLATSMRHGSLEGPGAVMTEGISRLLRYVHIYMFICAFMWLAFLLVRL